MAERELSHQETALAADYFLRRRRKVELLTKWSEMPLSEHVKEIKRDLWSLWGEAEFVLQRSPNRLGTPLDHHGFCVRRTPDQITLATSDPGSLPEGIQSARFDFQEQTSSFFRKRPNGILTTLTLGTVDQSARRAFEEFANRYRFMPDPKVIYTFGGREGALKRVDIPQYVPRKGEIAYYITNPEIGMGDVKKIRLAIIALNEKLLRHRYERV